MTNYVIASSKNWFKEHPKSKEYENLNLIEIGTKEELNLGFLEEINPRYIFFPHWNWKVNSEIYKRFECVAFHTAPLPYGRGGSPIQNLILKGFKHSPVCALKMTEVFDGGPIYDYTEVSLEGNITDIFSRIAFCIERLILKICQSNPTPIEQSGEVVVFNRLSISNNELLTEYTINRIYDQIRMLDGSDYPKAYIKFGNYRIEFTKPSLNGNELNANIRLYKNEN